MKRFFRLLSLGVVTVAATVALVALPSRASDHADSPGAIADPAADITDFYAFMRPTSLDDGPQAPSTHLVMIANLNPKVATPPPEGSPFDDRVTLTFRLRRVVSTAPLKVSPTDLRILCSFPTSAPPIAVCNIPNLGSRQFAIGAPAGDSQFRFFAGLRADPALVDRAALENTVATGQLAFQNPGTNTHVVSNVASVVIEFDVNAVLGLDGGTPPLLALSAETARQ